MTKATKIKTAKKVYTNKATYQTTYPMNDNKKQEIFVTKDKDLIKQYYELRNRIFREEWGLTHEKWSKTEHDDGAGIVVYTVDGKVRGGLKIFISKDGELLPEEYEGTEYVYSNLLKRLDLECGKRYAEFADLVIDKEFQGAGILQEIGKVCVIDVKSNGCEYIFCVAPLRYCRSYTRYGMFSGCTEVRIVSDTQWVQSEEYNDSKDYPTIAVL